MIFKSSIYVTDAEGLKSGKSVKNASTKIKKKLKDKMRPKLKSSSEADDEEKISTKIEEKIVSPGTN